MNTFTFNYVTALNVVIGAAAVAGPVIKLPSTDIPGCLSLYITGVVLDDPADVITVKAQVNDGSNDLAPTWLDLPNGSLAVTLAQLAQLSSSGKSPRIRFLFSAAGANAGHHDTLSISLSGLPSGTVIA